jgi:hypothetical protein
MERRVKGQVINGGDTDGLDMMLLRGWRGYNRCTLVVQPRWKDGGELADG